VVGCCECGDEPSLSGSTELVNLMLFVSVVLVYSSPWLLLSVDYLLFIHLDYKIHCV
jgi:hypothetical protein